MLSQRQALDFLLRLPLIGRLGPVFLRYLLVGGLGFVADALLLEIFVRLGLSVYVARFLSMTLAMGCTYALHRNFTFTDAAKPAHTALQAAAFVVCQCVAAAVNYGVFCLLLWLLPEPVGTIGRLFALCWGVGAGLAVNFVLLRLLVFRADGQARYETLMPKNLWRLIPWLFAAGVALRYALARQGEVLAWPQLKRALGPADPDVWMRLAQVRQWMEGKDFYSHAVPNTNAPYGGISLHWTRPMDALLGFFAQLMPGQSETQLMLAAAWLPPVLGLVALLFLIRAAQHRFDHAHVVWTMMLLAVMSPLRTWFAPGDADHHGLLAMLWCGVICLLMRPLNTARAVGAGMLLGVMVWVSVEALLPLAAVYALMGFMTLRDAAGIRYFAVMTLSAAIAAALGLAVEVPPGDYFTATAYDTLSMAHVALLAFIAAGAGILCLPKIVNLPQSLRVVAAFNVAIVAFLFEIAFFPRMMLGPMVDADYFISTNFLPVISEAMGIFAREPTVILNNLWQPALAAALVALSWQRAGAHKRRQLAGLAVLLALGFVMTIAQGRWTYYLQPSALVAIAALLPGFAMRARGQAFGWLKKLEQPLRPYAFLFGLRVSVAILTLLSLAGGGNMAQVDCQAEMRLAVQNGSLQKVLGGDAGTLYVPPGIGGDVLFFTPYRIIAGNYHREGAGLRELDAIARDSRPDATHKRMVERGVGAMLVCPSEQQPGSWMRRLKSGSYPSWLVPLPLDETDLLLFAVRDNVQ